MSILDPARRAVRLGGILSAAGCLACEPPAAEAPAATPVALFEDVTAEAGIDFVHQNGARGDKWMPETMGSGAAFFDYDGDGRLDLLLVNGRRWTVPAGPPATARLYRNRGDGTFEDATRAAGLNVSLYGMGAAAADYDGDGDADLYLTALGDNRLLRNEGGVFSDITAQAGVAGGHWTDAGGRVHPEWSTGAAFFDGDGDGWLDLFVCNYVRWSAENDLFTTIDGATKSYATPQQYDGAGNRFYRNRGDGTFEDRTAEAGLLDPAGKAMGVAVTDIDGDGRPDLVVANDTRPTFLYRNRGDGTFEETGLSAGMAYDAAGKARAGMGIDAAFGDRGLDIAIGNFSREPVSLYRRRGDGTFADEAFERGLGRPTYNPLTFGLVFFDADLDGRLDLILANGHIEPGIQAVQRDIPYAQLPQLFLGRDGGGFAAAAVARTGLERPLVGRGLAVGDIDGDGDLDAVISANGGPAALLRNVGATGNALRVRLRGRRPNADALGARVTLVAGGHRQRALVRTGSSYLSQSETVLTFGLGEAVAAESLAVRWPDGGRETLVGLEAGATYFIERDAGVIKVTPFR